MFRCRQSRFPQGRAWLGALTAMTASVALFGAGSASAADVLDAHCGDPTNPVGSSFNSFPRVGQTFTALNTGQLTSATVSVNKTGQPPPSQPDAVFSMQIRPLVSGVPGRKRRASAIATESRAGSCPTDRFFQPSHRQLLIPRLGGCGPAVRLGGGKNGRRHLWRGDSSGSVCGRHVGNEPRPGLGPWLERRLGLRDSRQRRGAPTKTQPPPTQPNTTAPTGQRAAARFKKCKKRFPGKAKAKKRKKCKKKANLLPV